MEKIPQLKTLIGEDRTLVIACNECDALDFQSDQVITILTLCNCLHPHDYDLRSEIKACIEKFDCKKIVVMGHYDCRILHQTLTRRDPTLPIQPIQNKLVELVEDIQLCNVKPRDLFRMMVELNVIEQMKVLMSYHFVRGLVDEEALTVSGVVFNKDNNQIIELNRNGWSYNSLNFLN